jgi:hypothetical protein
VDPNACVAFVADVSSEAATALAEAGLAMVRFMRQPPVSQLGGQVCCKVGPDLQAEVALMKQFETSALQLFHAFTRADRAAATRCSGMDSAWKKCGSVVDKVLRDDISIEAVVGRVFWALHHLLHQCGVVHNNVKPSNILSRVRIEQF